MAFKPILSSAQYNNETNMIVVIIEHIDGGNVQTRTYTVSLPTTLNAVRNVILNANTALNNQPPPAVLATIQSLIGTEIT